FAPDGKRVYFSSDVDGIYNLYSVDINTRQVNRLTRTLTGFFYPTPAEDKLYAIAYFKEGYDVVAIPYDGLLGETVDYFEGIDPELREEGDQPEDDREGYFDTEVDTDEELIALGEDDSDTDPGDQDEAINPDDWEESDYIGPFSIRPYLLGLLGPVSAFNLAVGARDPLLRHSFLAGVGPSVPDPLAVAYYDYTRFSTGLSLGYATNYWKRDRASGCLNEDSNPLRFVCDDKYSFFESAYGYLRHTDQGRYLTTQVLLGYVHNKIRNARRLRTVEYDARDLNLSGPSFVFLAGDARYFARSISPERGWRLSLQTDYFTRPESKDRVEEYFEHQIEYGVAEGGLAFYLPSFWLNHVNYLSAYAYGSYGPDREVQQVRLNRFVRGQEYEKAAIDHSAIVFTYEYRLPLYWRSDAFIGGVAGLTLRNVGMSVFFDYGASFDRDIYKEDFTAGAYGVNLLFGLNVAYLHLPEMKLSFARGTGPAGEFQVNLSFSAEFSTGVVGAGGRPSHYDNDALIEPFHRSLPGFDGQAGYFRDRRAGGILE
ncbi:MAG: hypothetical protein KDK27_12885, partial [Leptospiraceae bacterium]|nr:hypothetical protein [Leptospiraceae bacterium]